MSPLRARRPLPGMYTCFAGGQALVCMRARARRARVYAKVNWSETEHGEFVHVLLVFGNRFH